MKINIISFSFSLLAFLISNTVNSQQIPCKVSVYIIAAKDTLKEISNREVDYFFMGIYPVRITQTIDLSSYKPDTLTLYLEKPSNYHQLFPNLFFHNLSVTSQSDKDLSTTSLNYSFDGKRIFIKEGIKGKKITLGYEYQSDFFIKNSAGIKTLFFMQPQIYEWHSYYFVHKSMKLKDICFYTPKQGVNFFARHTKQSAKDGYYQAKFEDTTDYDNSFYLLRSDFYDRINIKSNNVSVNLYFNKGVLVDSLSLTLNDTVKHFSYIHPQNKPDSTLNKLIVNRLKTRLQKIEKLFDNNDTLTINIADANLLYKDKNDKKHPWGKILKCSEKSYFIAIDTSFWLKSGVTHEIIHTFNKYLPSKSQREYYLFHESIVEYLAVFFEYDDPYLRDSVFNSKNTEFNNLVKKGLCTAQSILEVKENEFYFNDGIGGTSPVIYFKTPYIIHSFSKSIGEEKFLTALKRFYAYSHKKQHLELSSLERILKEEGVTDAQWEKFMNDL